MKDGIMGRKMSTGIFWFDCSCWYEMSFLEEVLRGSNLVDSKTPAFISIDSIYSTLIHATRTNLTNVTFLTYVIREEIEHALHFTWHINFPFSPLIFWSFYFYVCILYTNFITAKCFQYICVTFLSDFLLLFIYFHYSCVQLSTVTKFRDVVR